MQALTTDVLVKRINRRLAYSGEKLRTSRGANPPADFGRFYILSERNVVTAGHVDLEELPRGLGVLRPGEGLEP